MPKFKKGDRVRVAVDGPRSPKGRVGTVAEDSMAPWVHFDDYNPSDFDAPIQYGGINIPAGYADCVNERHLELITNTMELTTTKDKIKEAAEKWPQAKEALRALFPDAVEKEPLKMHLGRGAEIVNGVWVGDWGNGIDGSHMITKPSIEVRTRQESTGCTIIEFFKKD